MASLLSVLRWIGRLGKRIYAFILAAILLYVFYLAVAYLIAMVFYPAPVPQRLLASPARLVAGDLRAENGPGITEPAARAPFAHYHQITQWLEVDKVNGCTLSGCHEPLPHSKSVYVRSFANFHTTFLTCQMCHEPLKDRSVAADWVNTQTGLQSDPPPLVQLSRLLQTQQEQIEKDSPAVNATIISLLQQIVTINNDPLLRYLQLEIATAEPGSPVWRDAIVRLIAELPQQSRGQYGAKIAPQAVAADYVRLWQQSQEAAKPFFDAAPGSAERKRVQDQIHAQVLAKPDRCLTCHGGTPPLLDFEKLGYSPQRTTFLQTNPVAGQVQSIREGRTFYLPRISEERR